MIQKNRSSIFDGKLVGWLTIYDNPYKKGCIYSLDWTGLLLNLNAAGNTIMEIEYRLARQILGCSYGIKVSFTVLTIWQVVVVIFY